MASVEHARSAFEYLRVYERGKHFQLEQNKKKKKKITRIGAVDIIIINNDHALIIIIILLCFACEENFRSVRRNYFLIRGKEMKITFTQCLIRWMIIIIIILYLLF